MSETAGSNTGFADNVPSFQKRAATPVYSSILFCV